MNIKKILQKLAEKDVEALITEEDKLFIQQLIQADEIKDIKEKADGHDKENGTGK